MARTSNAPSSSASEPVNPAIAVLLAVYAAANGIAARVTLEVTFTTTVKANTLQSVGLLHGTQAGFRGLVFMPAVQLISPSKQEIEGRRLIGYDMRINPSAGNDDLRIVTSF